jgi:hypothetical protein
MRPRLVSRGKVVPLVIAWVIFPWLQLGRGISAAESINSAFRTPNVNGLQ